MGIATGLFLIALAGVAGVPPVPPAPTGFVLLPVEVALTPQTSLGAKRAGLLCLPNGKLRWRDIAIDRDALSDRIARRLRDGGVNVVPSGLAEPGNRRTLHLSIDAIKASACAKRWGMGDRGSLTGSGTISMTWTVGAPIAGTPPAPFGPLEFQTVEAFVIDPAGDPTATIMGQAIDASARAAADRLRF